MDVMFKYWVILLVIIAFIMRIIFVSQGAVSFHYDMARDAFVVKQIWKDHKIKILGPPTSTPGLYHGVLYYYLIAPFYNLGQGDPRVVAIFLSLINALTVIPLCFLAKDLLKNKKLALLGGFLFVVSFEATQYAPWISNPSPALLTVSLVFYFLNVWRKGKEKGLYLATFFAALSAQFQFFLIYLLFLIPIFGLIFKAKATVKQIVLSLIIIFLVLSSFLISAIKFNTLYNSISRFASISTQGAIDFRAQFSEVFINSLNKFAEIFINNFFPTNVLAGGLLGFMVLYAIRKQKLILFYLFSNLPIVIFGGHSNIYGNIGLVTPAILGICFLISNIYKKYKKLAILLIGLIIISNLYAIFKNNPNGQVILVIPNDMILKNELNLIDQTYKIADGNSFSINTLTLPLWINTTWAYLYWWYGLKKYGYVPVFTGHNQVGLLGNDSLKLADKPLTETFFILEPHVGIPDDRYNWEIGAEDSKTVLKKEFLYGELRLQYRQPRHEK